MKRKLLLLILLCSIETVTCFAQSKHIEMLKEGRTWNCMSVYERDGQQNYVYYSYRVGEQTVYQEKDCFEIIRFDENGNQNEVYHVYEESGKTYQCWFNLETFLWEWLRIYDFNLGNGETDLFLGDVHSSDTICVNGVCRHRISFLADGYYKIVEGIGNSVDGPVIYDGSVSMYYRYGKLLSVYDGDELIFEEDDFMAPAITAIRTVSRDIPDKSTSLFDLSGRRLTARPQRGLYIRDGRKYVVKE